MKFKRKAIIIVLTILLLQMMCIPKVKAYTATELKQKLDYVHDSSGIINRANWTFIENYNKYGGGTCWGFANAVGLELFGCHQNSAPNDWVVTKNVEDLCVGDTIRYRTNLGNHSLVVINIVGNDVHIADANYDGNNGIRWDVVYNKATLNSMISSALWYTELGSQNYGYYRHYKNNNVKNVSDAIPPTISEAYVNASTIANDKYMVEASISDNVGLSSVKVATWTEKDGQDDLRWDDMVHCSDGKWRFCVNASDHKNENGRYNSHIYAWDAAGNQNMIGLNGIIMGSINTSNVANFTGRIYAKEKSNLVVGISGTSNGSAIVIQKENLSDKSQLWKFEKVSGQNYYWITNVSTGRRLDVDGGGNANGQKLQIWDANNSKAQQFHIMGYNGGYRLIPECSGNMRAVDFASSSYSVGTKLLLWEGISLNHGVQTVKFSKIATKLTTDAMQIATTVGAKFDMTYKLEPEDVTIKKLSWKSTNTKVATIDSEGKVTTLSAGTTKLIGTTMDGSNLTITSDLIVENAKTNNDVKYRSYVQNKEWQSYVTNGSQSGTTGSSLRMEAIQIGLTGNKYSGGIEYRTHIQNKGWETSWKSNYATSGTTGQALRLEAIQIRLTGDIAKYYDVYYRVHSQCYGWLGWTKNGESAGTQGFGYRVESIQIKLVKKGGAAPGTTANCFVINEPNKGISYSTHVQNIGWQGYKSNCDISGTTGKGLRLEGIKINLDNFKLGNTSGGIQYRTHIQNIGWQNYVSNNALSGTTGKALRLEAIQIKLTGNLANKYDIYYRVHSQKFGWLGWAKNGQSAGTSGLGYRLEGIQIRLVEKGKSAPGSTANAYRTK